MVTLIRNGAPPSDIDPFDDEFLADPFSALADLRDPPGMPCRAGSIAQEPKSSPIGRVRVMA